MKYIFRHYLFGALLLVITNVIVSCESASEDPVTPPKKVYSTMLEALKDVSIVDSVKVLKVEQEDEEFKEQYTVYLRQLVDHQQTGKYFRQKMIVRFRGFDRPTVMVTHGYDLQDKSKDGHSIAKRINANIVEVEHRNFNESMVEEPNRWDYETQYQEAGDLHAVFTAMKAILPGKWMSTGTSKNGETSIGYNYIYPEDMDLCAAFCSPLLTSQYDVRCGKYMLQESGTQEQRTIMDAGIRRYLTGGEQGLYKTFSERIEQEGLPKPSFSEYVFNVFEVYFNAFSYYTTDKRLPLMATIGDSEEDLYKKWHNLLVFNRDPTYVTYYVDGCKWQGFFQNDYDVYKEYLNGTSFSPRAVNLTYVPQEARPFYDTYSNAYQLQVVNEYLPFTGKPTLLVFSKDDPWTGGRPEHINPVSTKMIINPNGIHGDSLDNEEHYTPALSQEIVDFVNDYIY